jgi:dTDP-4-amino-4,6-dideoxygalactose transaminase
VTVNEESATGLPSTAGEPAATSDDVRALGVVSKAPEASVNVNRVAPRLSAGSPAVRVPLLDLGASHRDLRRDLVATFGELIDSGAFTNGPQVAELEAAFARYCDVPFCIGLASGLDALRLALVAIEPEPGEEAILPANTYVATAEAVVQAGLVPVLADVSTRDYNVDHDAVKAAVTSRTRVVVAVHLYGQMADTVRLLADARSRGLDVVEDACQAHGARRDGLGAGAAGRAGAFSFYPGKNLGAFGDAGALVTGDERLAARVRALREHGQTAKHRHEAVGYTARLDTVQAAVLLRKLPLLPGWTEERRTIACAYSEALAGVGDLRLPPVPPGSEPVWHLYEIRTGRADKLAAFLEERGVQTGRHYPSPVHLTPAFAHLGHGPGAFPVSEALALELVSLPIYPGLGDDRLDIVVTAIREFFDHG